MNKILCDIRYQVRSWRGQKSKNRIGICHISVTGGQQPFICIPWHKMEIICTKIRLCRYVSHNKCWSDLTWPDLTGSPTVLRRKLDNRSTLWRHCDLTWPCMYTSEILHIYALGIHLKLYEISRRSRDAFQSYYRKTKGVGPKIAPPHRLEG